ncbi:helix-turn-helix domain-containing protein [Actinocorallia sp. API 0066]|uniref:Scr1 family TA system antitoxin-like transcriptional regulator n=1 Tax=Actinocorallia sp. API 0066 TaxID=2896846 RepID=UPI001E51FE81|nr:Scr1 family TA system antitoxin-like transcriptional regulator [Actinocorallia sp. API 0066]MCD0452415.1 helix-turn-helix domain-containing protein [Actinocorallia sp. API 0066]
MGGERFRELGVEVRRLRVAAGLSGVEVGRRAGVTQATVSRVETGRRVADVGVVVRVIEAVGGGVELVAMAREVYAEAVRRRVDAGTSLRGGAAAGVVGRVGVVRALGVAVVPLVVRTAEYAREAGLKGGGVDLLGKRVEVVVGEGVLRTWPGSGACMAGQLERLVEVAGGELVEFGVVPLGVAGGGLPPHGFTVFGEEAVVVETVTRELTLTAAGDVSVYLRVFDEVRERAVFGDEAVARVMRAAADLRRALDSIQRKR